ncbi:MAG: BatD family protein [Gammaproteobacteria bacterium]|nr:BatD family protein [Gammaproteobacteria bacterium]TVQ50135.1 MAG: hypothetical protein EA371_01355 [Gammaproteobacteria bacterium]
MSLATTRSAPQPARAGALVRVVCLVFAVCSLLMAAAANAAPGVTAWLERDAVPEDESLTLHLSITGDADEIPDWSVLLADFEILHRARQTRIRADGETFRQEVAWELGLMPRGDAVREVPPVPVGEWRTPALPFVRLPPGDSPVAGRDVVVEASVAADETWVFAELVYTTRLYLAVGARGTRLSEPRVIEGEATLRRLGEARQYQLRRDGRHYLVWEQHHALVPQRSGALVIDAVVLEAELSSPGQRSRRIRVQSEPVNITVHPPPPRPEGLPDGPWLPAAGFELRLEAPAGPLRAGEPVTLELVATALGASPAALTVPLPESSEAGLRLYPERPRLDTGVDASGVSQLRQVQPIVLLATAEGVYPGLELRVPWFDTRRGRWAVAEARLPALEVLPVVAARSEGHRAPTPIQTNGGGPPGVTGGQAPAAGPDAAAVSPGARELDPWRLAALVFALGWALTLAWVWSTARGARWRRARSRTAAGRAATAPGRAVLKRLARAARQDDPVAARDALLAWAAQQWPEAPPRAIGELAARLPATLAGPVHGLSRALYADEGDRWRGHALARIVDDLQRLPRETSAVAQRDGLPPLWPRPGV